MEKVFLQVLPLAVAGAVSPTGLLFVMMILSGKDNPNRKALSFVIGSTVFLIVLGIFVGYTYKSAVHTASRPKLISAVVDIGLGLLILAIVIRSVFLEKKEKPAKERKWKIPYLLVGFMYMIINISTLIPFIAAIKVIADDKLESGDNLFLFAAVLVITMFMIAFPVVITFLAPKSSERILGPVKTFMSKHGSQIADVYFALMAVYLILKGISAV